MSEVQGAKYWATRPLNDPKRDWTAINSTWVEDYWASESHPHRQLIVDAVGHCEPFESLLELGCSVGVNISLLRKKFPYLKDSNLAGIDINEDSIKSAKEHLPAIDWQVRGLDRVLPFVEKSFDIVLADAVLMYIDSTHIESMIGEMDRVSKKAIVVCDWYDESLKGVVKDFHWARDYGKLLEVLGYKVEKVKITKAYWNSNNWVRNGYIFIAKK